MVPSVRGGESRLHLDAKNSGAPKGERAANGQVRAERAEGPFTLSEDRDAPCRFHLHFTPGPPYPSWPSLAVPGPQ